MTFKCEDYPTLPCEYILAYIYLRKVKSSDFYTP